jgi:serine/threonine-protein kinase
MNGLVTGTVVDGRYEIVERLGSGGMADVYCAVDQQLGRRIALKVLYQRFAADTEFVERFRREASSAAGLSHQNVVSVYDRGEWDGTYYIAMEYLEGRSLKAIVQAQAPLESDRAIDLAVQVLRAARFAHKRGIIHRDFKPHNVLVDDESRAKVTDFGIARAGASDMTQTGSIMGTAQYLSPEQAQGHAVSARSDLYSIGIVLYEMLTGQLPFDGESAVTIALKQVSEPPVPPSHLNPAVSPQLEAAVLCALAKDPTDRFADAGEFIAALEAARGTAGDHGAAYLPPAVAPIVPLAPDLPPATVYDGVYPAEPLPPREPREHGRRRWWALLAGLLVAAAIVAGVLLLGMGKQVTVPRVVGTQLEAASAKLRDRGLELSITHLNDPGARGTVIRQNPVPGTRVREGMRIALTVSDGPGTVAVPDIAGLGRRAAAKALSDAGFQVRQRGISSNDVLENDAIRTSPAGNTPRDIGSTVTLVYSTGKPKVAVPSVTGQQEDAATTALEDLGLTVTVVDKETDTGDPGSVLQQDPAPDTPVTVGSTVKITVARAPSRVELPDVTGETDADAVRRLSHDGFEVHTVDQDVATPDQDGVVLSQNPAGGEKVKPGSKVKITVGRFNPNLNPEGTLPTPTTTAPTVVPPSTP